ncbi:MAG: protein kinase [Gemmatimonadota bacterium]|nr:MAG: protein kinase [Gemmatimonadota bacterium]
MNLLEGFRHAIADRYAIEGELGRGGMAIVYLAQDLRHNRQVAIKVLKPEYAATVGPERFLREIEIAAQLHHPHILPLHDSGDAAGFLYFVMPYVPGSSLRHRLDREKRLPLSDVVRVLRDVADALTHAHERGVVHRDIKPENVLLSGQHALVTDFGVAKAVSEAADAQLTGAGITLGTPAYMAPEQAAAEPNLDHRLDIYALGVVGYEMLAGRPPFHELTPQQVLRAHLTRDAEPVSRHREDVTPEFERVVMRCLEKEPAKRWQSASELLAQLETLTTPTETRPVAAPRRRRRLWLPLGAVFAAVLIALGVLQPWAGPPLDRDLFVVPPFDVLEDELADPWREGLAQIVANNLDGAGPLRAVPPSVISRRWSGSADAATVRDAARANGAGLAVYGRLLAAGPDSVRVNATLFDAVAGVALAEFSLRDAADRIDRLADSLSMRVINELGEVRPIGVVKLGSLGSSSPTAVKAFLQGEQLYWRMQLDSARRMYQRAVEEDSSFALAYHRLARASSWGTHDEYHDIFLKAGALNHGLARRESLLVATDSLLSAAAFFSGDSASWQRFRRLFTTAELATRLYPTDPQSWYNLGEARFHYATYVGTPLASARAAFQRAIELDSAFAPAYVHLITLSLLEEGRDTARAYVERYLDRGVGGVHAASGRALVGLLDPRQARSEGLGALLDSLRPDAFFFALMHLDYWPDSAESAVRLARAWAASPDSLQGKVYLAASLAFRGHAREAYAVLEPGTWPVLLELALLGVVPPEKADSVGARALEIGHGWASYGSLRWWAARGDTAMLDRAASFFEEANLPYARAATRGYRALATGDSAAALRQFAALRTWPCHYCYHERLVQAQLLTSFGDYAAALALLDEWRWPPAGGTRTDMVLWALERGRLNELLGNDDAARDDFSYVLDIWRNADPELQPYVEEARAALLRLAAESP